MEFVFDGVAWTASPGPRGVTALDHEAIDHAMEDYAIKEILFRQIDEVLRGRRRTILEQLDAERAAVGVETGIPICHNTRWLDVSGCKRAKTRRSAPRARAGGGGPNRRRADLRHRGFRPDGSPSHF